ncbi:helix-turn-helix transcriptional regulator [Gemella sp. 19428wG2_WT2a]|nr:helix-turn-helix transcriptional regulator [Gemella sp. 19428wG2_WT2a]TFU57710.1 XRE family transcriptional regulator [Gemella sp. WT2a]
MDKFRNIMNEKLKEKGISRYKLSKLTGISQPLLYKIANNKVESPKFSDTVKIARELDIDLNVFK